MDYNNNHDSNCLSYENGIDNTLNFIKNKEIINTDFNMNKKLKIFSKNLNQCPKYQIICIEIWQYNNKRIKE